MGSGFPVIVLTGQGNESIAVEAMKNGAQDYLLKSTMTAASLLRAVENAIQKVTLLRGMQRQTRELSEANAELQREVANAEARGGGAAAHLRRARAAGRGAHRGAVSRQS